MPVPQSSSASVHRAAPTSASRAAGDAVAPVATAAGLRICHVAYSFYESDNRVIRYAETLAADGADVEVIALRRPQQASAEQLRGVNVRRVQRRSKNEKRPLTYFLKIMSFLVRAAALLTVRHFRRP